MVTTNSRLAIVAAPQAGTPTPADPGLVREIHNLGKLLRKTPTIRLEHPAFENLYAKLEDHNTFGSLKDRTAFWILKTAIERGEVQRNTVLLESSSGNLAVGLASLCQKLRLCFVAVVDPNITPDKKQILKRTCHVLEVNAPDASGNYLEARLRLVGRLRENVPGSFWTNQYENPANAEAHYRLTGGEIVRAFNGRQLDLLFVGVGTGGTIAGVSRRVKETFPNVKVIAVDSKGSAALGGPSGKRYLPGLGSSRVPPHLATAQIDDVVIVDERETVRACRELSERFRLFVGASSGTVYAAVEAYARRQDCAQQNILFICPDGGMPYRDTVHNRDWFIPPG